MNIASNILILLVLLAFLSGCTIYGGGVNVVNGSGKVVTENRSVSNFTGVSLAGIGELTVTQGNSEALSIEGEDNILAVITTDVRNGILYIGTKPQVSVRPTKTIKYNLSVKNLNSLELAGVGSIRSSSIKGDKFTLVVSGTGDVQIDHLEASDLTSRLVGAGNVNLTGQVTGQQVTLSGIGAYRAANLQSKTATVEVNGAGGGQVWATDTLDVTISGAGSVEYYGNPKVTKKISGIGQVKSNGNK